MERIFEVGKINGNKQFYDFAFLIGAYAQVRFFIQREHLDFQKGLLIITENHRTSEQIKVLLGEKMGAREIRNCAQVPKIPNNCIGFHMYKYHECEKFILDFMENPKFLPIVISDFILPEYLREYVYCIDGSDFLYSRFYEQKLQNDCVEFFEFVKNNIPAIFREINRTRNTELFQKAETANNVFSSALIIALNILKNFWETKYRESEVNRLYTRYKYIVKSITRKSMEFEEEYDITDIINKIFDLYLAENPVLFCNILEVDGNVDKALNMGKAILFDDSFYYITDALLRDICTQLFQNVSFITIKYQLRAHGIIDCGINKNNNFTVKKVFVNVYGQVRRERFIKFRKSFFQTNDSLGLEEMVGGKNVPRQNTR